MDSTSRSSATYADNMNAGTATATASYAGDANHNGSTGTETFAIGKATTTTVVTAAAPFTYTGAAHEPCTASATGSAA